MCNSILYFNQNPNAIQIKLLFELTVDILNPDFKHNCKNRFNSDLYLNQNKNTVHILYI